MFDLGCEVAGARDVPDASSEADFTTSRSIQGSPTRSQRYWNALRDRLTTGSLGKYYFPLERQARGKAGWKPRACSAELESQVPVTAAAPVVEGMAN